MNLVRSFNLRHIPRIQPQRLALPLNRLSQEHRRLFRIRFHTERRANHILQPVGEQSDHVHAAGDGRHGAQVGGDARGDEVGADGDGLFRVPLGRRAGHGQVADIHAQGIGQGRNQYQDAHVVHAGAHVQHRRNTQGLADLLQAGAGHFGGLGHFETGLGGGHGDAAGVHDKDVVLDQALRQGHVAVIVFDLGVVAAHNAHGATDLAGLDGVDEGRRRAAQGADDGLNGKAAHGRLGLDGDKRLALAVGKVLHRRAYHVHGLFLGVVGMEFLVLHVGELGLVAGTDHLGMVAAAHLAHRRHDALVVDNHHVDDAGGEDQLGHQMVAGHGDAPAHEQFVARAANAHQVDPHGALAFGQVEQLRGLAGRRDHLRDHRVVAVHHDIDLVGLEHAGVDRGGPGGRHAKKNVGHLGGDHGAAPAVGQGVAQALEQKGLPVVVHAHVGAVHHLGCLAVNAARGDIELLPDLAPLLGCARDQLDLLLAHAIIFHHSIGQFSGNGQGRLAFRGHAVLGGHAFQFLLVADRVAQGAAVGHPGQDFHQIAAVVRVSGSTGSNHATEVAGHDDVGIGAANAGLGAFTKGIDPAGSHHADAAGKAHVAEPALGLLGVVAFPYGFDTVLAGLGI
ncbi:hypothetical protein DESC_760048 [Desulfosarcina cetonica]|nr:hypothetical protein DESC_760048 [Desulfosarcina cetonica]